MRGRAEAARQIAGNPMNERRDNILAEIMPAINRMASRFRSKGRRPWQAKQDHAHDLLVAAM